MIKIILKNTALLEKAKVLIDNNVVGIATQKKPAIVELRSGKHILQLKNANGQSIPIEISKEDNITELVYSVNWFKSFKEGYWDLLSPTNIGNNTTIANTTSSNITKESMYCSKCGKEISRESAFCNGCGQKIEEMNTQAINETDKPQSNTINENIKKKTNTSLIIILSIIGLTIGVMWGVLSNNFDNNSSNMQQDNLNKYIGTWELYNTWETKEEQKSGTTLIMLKDGTYSEKHTSKYGSPVTMSGTYKIDGDVITFTTKGGSKEEYQIINNNLLRSIDKTVRMEYRR